MDQSSEGSIRLTLFSSVKMLMEKCQPLPSIQLQMINSQHQDILDLRQDNIQQLNDGNEGRLSLITKSQQYKIKHRMGADPIKQVNASQGDKAENHFVRVKYTDINTRTNFQQISFPASHNCLYGSCRGKNLSKIICNICKQFTLQPCTSACDQICFQQKSQYIFQPMSLESINDERQLILALQIEQQKKQETNMKEQKMPTEQQPEKHQKQQKPGCCHCNNGCLKKNRCGCVLKGIRCSDKCNCVRQICQNKPQKIVDQILSFPSRESEQVQSDANSLSSHMSFTSAKLNQRKN